MAIKVCLAQLCTFYVDWTREYTMDKFYSYNV